MPQPTLRTTLILTATLSTLSAIGYALLSGRPQAPLTVSRSEAEKRSAPASVPRIAPRRSTVRPSISSAPTAVAGKSPNAFALLNDEASRVGAPLSDPAESARRLDWIASHLSRHQIRSLATVAADANASSNHRALAIDVLSRNGSPQALRDLEKIAYDLRNLDGKGPIEETVPIEGALLYMIVDALVQKSSATDGRDALARIESNPRIQVGRPYVERMRKAIETGTLARVYREQDDALRAAAGT